MPMAGTSDLSLKLSYWFVSHRQQFRRWWFIVLLGIDFLLIVYVAIALTFYISGTSEARQVITSMPRTAISSSYKTGHQPMTPTFSETFLLTRGDGRSDLAVRVQNNDTRWAGVIHYTFTYQEQTIASGTSYIAPSAIGYLLGLNASLAETVQSSAVTMTVSSIDWIFTSSHPDAVMPSFLVGSTHLTATTQSGSPATVVTSTVSNTAVVGWREVPVNVVLTIGDQIVGVNQFVVRNWESLADRTINVQWRRSFSSSVLVNIIPVANPFDRVNVIR